MCPVFRNKDLSAQEDTTSYRILLIETLVFLLVILPPLIASLFSSPNWDNINFTTTMIVTLLHNFGVTALVFYFLWRNTESPRTIGLTYDHIGHEVLKGCLLFLPILLIMFSVTWIIRGFGAEVSPNPLRSVFSALGLAGSFFTIFLMVFVSVAEEIIFRGYLLHRFNRLFKSSSGSILLSSFIFSLGHGHQGFLGVITSLVLGLMLGVVVARTHNLTAPITIHFLNNSLAVIVWSNVPNIDALPIQ